LAGSFAGQRDAHRQRPTPGGAVVNFGLAVGHDSGLSGVGRGGGPERPDSGFLMLARQQRR